MTKPEKRRPRDSDRTSNDKSPTHKNGDREGKAIEETETEDSVKVKRHTERMPSSSRRTRRNSDER